MGGPNRPHLLSCTSWSVGLTEGTPTLFTAQLDPRPQTTARLRWKSSEPHRRSPLACALALLLSAHPRASTSSRMLDQHGLEDNDLREAESIHLIGIAPRGLQTGLGGPVRLRRRSQQAQRRQRR